MSFGGSPFDISSNLLKPKHFNAMTTRAMTCGEGQRQRWNYTTQQYECVRDDGFRFNVVEDVETWVGYYRQGIVNRESGIQEDLTSARTTYQDRLPNALDDDRILFQQQTTLTHQLSDDRRMGDVTGQTQQQREYALSRDGIGEVTSRWYDWVGAATWRRNMFGDDPQDNQMLRGNTENPVALTRDEMENVPLIPQPTLWERYLEIQRRVFREQVDTASGNEEEGYDFTYTPEEQSVIDEQTKVEDSYYDRVNAWYSANYSGGLDEDGEVRTNTGYWDDDDNYVEGESTWIGDGEEPVFSGTGEAPEGRETAVTTWEFDVPAVQTVWCAVGDCDNPDSNSRRQLCWMGYDEYCDGDDSLLTPLGTNPSSDTSTPLTPTIDDSQNLTPVDTTSSQTSDGATQAGLYGMGGTSGASGTGGNYHGCSGVNERYDSRTQDCQCADGFSRDLNTGECVGGTPNKPLMSIPTSKPKGFWNKVWDGLTGGV